MNGFQKLMIVIGILFLVCIFLCLFGFLFLPDDESSTTPIETINTNEGANVAKNTTVPNKKIKAPFEIKTDIEGLNIEITKITNEDLLNIHVKYKNNTGQLLDLTTSLCRIVADGKQQDSYNDAYLDLNQNILYELENGVEYEQIIPFDKIKSNTFNLVLVCNYEEYRVNNIQLGGS
jgi:hypothetical protein